jgi:hypothetical protein
LNCQNKKTIKISQIGLPKTENRVIFDWGAEENRIMATMK